MTITTGGLPQLVHRVLRGRVGNGAVKVIGDWVPEGLYRSY